MNENEAKNYFEEFWRKHPYKTITFKDDSWSYVLSGKKDNPDIILIQGFSDKDILSLIEIIAYQNMSTRIMESLSTIE